MTPCGKRTLKKFALKAICRPIVPTFGLLGRERSPPARLTAQKKVRHSSINKKDSIKPCQTKKIYLNQKKPSQIIMNGNLTFSCVDRKFENRRHLDVIASRDSSASKRGRYTLQNWLAFFLTIYWVYICFGYFLFLFSLKFKCLSVSFWTDRSWNLN